MPRGEEHPERLTVELLVDQHDREGFDCGIEPLNTYLRRQASQDTRRGVAVTYVLVAPAARAEVLGFYTLSSSAVALADLPESVSKKLPRYPRVPTTLIGRLAIDKAQRGRRLGERLLVDALERCLDASRTVASVAVFVDAKDDDASRMQKRLRAVRAANRSPAATVQRSEQPSAARGCYSVPDFGGFTCVSSQFTISQITCRRLSLAP